MKLKCGCGSSEFSVPVMTLELRGVPCTFTGKGPDYDDTKASYSVGWDSVSEPHVNCVKCGQPYLVTLGRQGQYKLVKENRV